MPELDEATELDDQDEELVQEQGEVQGSSKSQDSSSSQAAASSKDKPTAPTRPKRCLVMKHTEDSDADSLSSEDFAAPMKDPSLAPPLAKKAKVDLFASGFAISS